VELELKRKFFNNCRLDQPLNPQDPFYYPFDQRELRGLDCVKRMADTIRLSEENTWQLFTGLRGSGKTSEFERLTGLLKASGHCVVCVHAENEGWIDKSQPLKFGDVLFIVCFALQKDLPLLGKAVEWFEDVSRRFWNSLNSEIQLEKLGISATVPGGLGPELEVKFKSEPTFRQQLNQRLAATPGALKKHVHQFVQEVGLKLSAHSGKLVLLIDDLEKYAETFVKRSEHEDYVRDVFLNHSELLRVPCHVVYTIPPFMAQHGAELGVIYSGDLSFLPMVRVQSRTGSPEAAGVKALVEGLRRRVNLEQAFVDAEGAPRVLAEKSGGYLRDLLRLMRECLMLCSDKPDELITPAIVERAVKRVQNEYRESLLQEHRPLLAQTHESHEYPLSTQNRDLFGDLIRSHMLLRYHNDREWYDAHPLLWESLARLTDFVQG